MRNQRQLSLDLFSERLQERKERLALWLETEIRSPVEVELVIGEWHAKSFRLKRDAGAFCFHADGKGMCKDVRGSTSPFWWQLVEQGAIVASYGDPIARLHPRDYLGMDFPFVYLSGRGELVMTNDDTSLFYILTRGKSEHAEPHRHVE